MNSSPEIEAYFRDSQSWDSDRAQLSRQSERRAWRVAICAGIGMLLCASGLVLLEPLKQVVPFLVRVDNSTGIVDVVPSLSGTAQFSEVLTRYLLTHYVTVCERFNYATAESDYQECGAFHTARRNQLWYAQWMQTNPESPLNLYKDGTTLQISVAAVSFFKRANGMGDIAQVRYVKRLQRGSSAHEEMSHWIATIQYAYSEPSSNANIRALNPLGFKIEDFRSEPEIMGEPSSSAAASATSVDSP